MLVYTQKHTAGWTPENVLCIFPRKNLPNGAKLPVRNASYVKKGRFPLKNFRLGWMRVSAGKYWEHFSPLTIKFSKITSCPRQTLQYSNIPLILTSGILVTTTSTN
jgi:hypothetical protein